MVKTAIVMFVFKRTWRGVGTTGLNSCCPLLVGRHVYSSVAFVLTRRDLPEPCQVEGVGGRDETFAAEKNCLGDFLKIWHPNIIQSLTAIGDHNSAKKNGV